MRNGVPNFLFLVSSLQNGGKTMRVPNSHGAALWLTWYCLHVLSANMLGTGHVQWLYMILM